MSPQIPISVFEYILAMKDVINENVGAAPAAKRAVRAKIIEAYISPQGGVDIYHEAAVSAMVEAALENGVQKIDPRDLFDDK